MKQILLYISLLFLSQDKDGPKVDVELQPYVKEFLVEAEHWRVPVDHYSCLKAIKFVDEIPKHYKDSIVGQYDPVEEVIYIKNAYRDPRFIRLVVFHEMGHAVLNLNHDNHKISIMNSFLKYEFIEAYNLEWNYLTQDIFLNALRLENYRRLNENK